ncbi:MAG: M3 family metallopeptidase [Chlamydiota bacterium]
MLFTALLALFPMIHSAQEVGEYLPFSESAIDKLVDERTGDFERKVEEFLVIPEEKRTFDNTIRSWDFLNGEMVEAMQCLVTLSEVYPEKRLRDCAAQAFLKLEQTFQNTLVDHPEIDAACRMVQKNTGSLAEEEQYFLEHLLAQFRKEGLHLQEEQRSLFFQLSAEISHLASEFRRNIAEDGTCLFVPREELIGLEDDWIESHEQNAEGAYRLSCDIPTLNAVLTQCSVEKTRKAMHVLFCNRAYPKNEEVIVQLIAKRDALAQLLGFSSCAAHEISGLMALSPEGVEAFLKEIKEAVAAKAELEFKRVTEELPESVVLTSSGQLHRYDESYAFNAYCKKHFSIDEQMVAEYFPTDQTIEGLIGIYEQFFNLAISEVPHTLPIPDVRALEIRSRSDQLLGIVFLDLFTREGKCGHSGVCYPMVAAFSPEGGPHYPAVTYVICNISRPLEGRPSLMRHGEVSTFFHEFGHAIHSVLARQQFYSFCGLMGVACDFVEVPSMLLEKWVLDPTILKMISSHHLTQEPLPEEWIHNLITSHHFGRAMQLEKDCLFSELSLAFFAEGAEKNPTQLLHQLWERGLPRSSIGEYNHMHTSWWHVSGYGAKYYSYRWSEALACSLFEKIREGGLLNSEVGTLYVRDILSKGGSRDPALMVTDFLGMEPTLEPFFAELSRDRSF